MDRYVPFPPDWLVKSPHRPPNDTVGDEHRADLYHATGRLTAAWERLEFGFSLLWAALTKIENAFVASATYGTVIASGARINMLRAAAETALVDDEASLERVKEFLDIGVRLGAVRNLIAHGMIVIEREKFWQSALDYQPDEDGASYFITPALYNTGKTDPRGKPKILYNSGTVHIVTGAINVLQVTLEAFIHKVFHGMSDDEAEKAWQWIVWKTEHETARSAGEPTSK